MLQEFESEILSAGNNSGQPVGTPDGMNSSIEIVRSYIRGDINGDWCIDIVDALLAAQYFVGLLPLIDIYAGDVNGDGEVDIVDALLIAQFFVGLITEFPADANTPPVANHVNATTVENESVIIDVLFNDTDVDGDALSIDSVSQPLNGTAIIEDNAIRYTPDTMVVGADSFTYTISDGRGGFDTATVTVTVSGICCPDYRAVDDTSETEEDTPMFIDVLANDTDVPPYLDYMTVKSITPPQNGTAEIVNNQILYTPDADFYGQDTFQYEGNDMHISGTATVTVTVLPVNDPPLAADDSATTREDTPVMIDVLVNDDDVDGDVLTISSIGVPLNGAAAITAGLIDYTPDEYFNGTDTFSYTISDGNGGSDTGSVTVSVESIPYYEAVSDYAETYEDTSVIIDVLANDVIDESVYIESVGIPVNGSAEITENGIEYTPNPDYSGTDSFIYIIADLAGATDTATVTVTVLPVNDDPA